MRDSLNDSAAVDPAPATDSLPVTKAGLFIYGRLKEAVPDRRTHMLIGLSDRYGPAIYPTLPKGSIDPGETPLEAARREVMEETGVDIRRLLGSKRYEALGRGEEIRDHKSNGYKGVTVLSAKPEAVVDHVYTSRFGKQHRTAFYAIEVDGIDKLKSSLKGCKGSGQLSPWKDSMRMAKAEGLPNFDTCLSIMRSGVIPAQRKAKWAPSTEDKVLFDAPALPALEQKYGITNRSVEDFSDFCASISGTDHRTLLLPQLTLLKKHLQESGLTGDDNHPLKFDISDRPLTYYQEKADIRVVSDVLRHSHALMKESPVFAGSMWGAYAGKPGQTRSEDEKIDTAQVTALTEFFARVSPMDVAAAAMGAPNIRQKKGKEPLDLDPHMLRVIERKLPPGEGWAERLRAEAPKDRNR